MVTIGSLSWVAKVEKASRTQQKVDNLSQGFEEAGGSAQAANQAIGGTEKKLGGASKASSRTNNRFTRLSAITALLTTSIAFLSSTVGRSILRLTGLSSIAATLSRVFGGLVAWFLAGIPSLAGVSGAVATLSGWFATASALISGFIGWLAAGSAGALALAGAIGVAIGMFAVWVLHITGVMDWIGRLGEMVGNALPGWVSDGLLMVISIFSGGLAVLGGFINGFIEGAMRGGLVKGIETGFERAGQVLDVFIGAWERNLGRAKQFVTNLFGGIGENLAEAVRGTFNALIPSTLNIPSITIGGGEIAGQSIPSVTIGGGSINLPQLQTGGLIERAGAFMGHPGELVVPADVTRNITSETQALTGGDGGGSTIQSLTIEIGDQTLDLSNLSRLEIEELAEAIADELGREVEGIV